MLNTVSAAENVQKLYLKMHKEAKRFQKKGCQMSNELGVIFNNQMVNFKDVYSSSNATTSAFLGERYHEENYTSLNARRHRSPTPISYLEGKREARALDIVEVRTLTRPEASPRSEAFSITKCVKCLESIEKFKDVDWREMFMAMSAQRKLV
ncbi:hypothetical protein CISIN_1g038729mg, partial [Citrus sinensis]